MIAIWDRPREIAAFVSQGLWDGRRTIENCQALGFGSVEEGLVAGFLYHNYDPDAGVIEITAYSTHRGWTNKDRVAAIFRYPFEQLGVRLVVARTSEFNKPVLRIWRALGADFYRIPDLRADGEAEIISLYRREKWKSSRFGR